MYISFKAVQSSWFSSFFFINFPLEVFLHQRIFFESLSRNLSSSFHSIAFFMIIEKRLAWLQVKLIFYHFNCKTCAETFFSHTKLAYVNSKKPACLFSHVNAAEQGNEVPYNLPNCKGKRKHEIYGSLHPGVKISFLFSLLWTIQSTLACPVCCQERKAWKSLLKVLSLWM